MKGYLKLIIMLFGYLALVLVIPFSLKLAMNFNFFLPSVVKVQSQIESPSKKYIATVFEYHTGGIDSYAYTLINIRRKDEAFLPVKHEHIGFWKEVDNTESKDNVFEMDGFGFAIKIYWDNDQTLHVVFPFKLEKNGVYAMQKQWDDVQIVYQELNNK